jgi:hypothetical protein
LFVESNDLEVRRLYYVLSLYFAKCDGLISDSEAEHLNVDCAGIPFDPYQTPVVRRESILIRLKFLKKYRIDNPREIVRVLTWGLFVSGGFNPSDRKYFAKFVENPDKSFAWFARDLGLSVSSVFEAYCRLNDKIRFRFGTYLNYPLFKLKHLVVFFRPNENFDGSLFTRDFVLSLNKDTLGEWMWASFLVPNQTRILREFTESLKKMSLAVFEDHRLYEIKSMSRSCNVSMFDGEKWMPSEDVLGVGSFKFAEQGEGILPRLKENRYTDRMIRFDAVDFIVACLKFGNAREKNSRIKKVLSQYGYDLSSVTISKRLTSLGRAGLFMPAFSFYGLGLNVALTFAAECDERVTETLFHAFPQLPDCMVSRTDKGVIFMVRTTSESAPAISYLLQTYLADRVDRLITTNRIENLGASIPTAFYSHWNRDKQYWEYERGYFDLTKKLQSRK